MKPEARVIIYLVRGARVSLGEENNRLAATVVWGAQSFGPGAQGAQEPAHLLGLGWSSPRLVKNVVIKVMTSLFFSLWYRRSFLVPPPASTPQMHTHYYLVSKPRFPPR